jgi:hypothetical protein
VKVQYKLLKPRKVSVAKEGVKSSSGITVTVRRLDADSKTFSDDLRYVFEKNVEKARRDNKKPRQKKG